jgi:hypothetical protein
MGDRQGQNSLGSKTESRWMAATDELDQAGFREGNLEGLMSNQYIPLVFFEIHPVATADQIEEYLKIMSAQ